MTQPLVENLPNGWTFSLTPDMSGLGYSVAAYPTKNTDPEKRVWFKFKNGREEERVFSFAAAALLYARVLRAKPPVAP